MAEKKSKKKKELEVYSAEELKKLEEFVEKSFGEIDTFFQEKESEGIQLNFYVIPPTREHRCYTVVTNGMGAHIMNVPEELADKHLERAELAIDLPSDWKFGEEEQKYFWPVHLLNLLAHLPINENAWLGFGHTVDYGKPFSDYTELCSVILVRSKKDDEMRLLKLSDDKIINFYQVIPLYKRELEYKMKHGAFPLLDHFPDLRGFVSDPERPCCIPENYDNIIDRVEIHTSKITKKKLDIPDICGASHMAVFFRYAMQHGLISDDTKEFFAEEFTQMRKGELDIRKFIINNLGGELTKDLFNDLGASFADWYYDFYSGDDEHQSFPCDVDELALKYFGEERYNCEEFGDEAYMFVPYDDKYRKTLSGYINRAFKKFMSMEKSISEEDLTNP